MGLKDYCQPNSSLKFTPFNKNYMVITSFVKIKTDLALLSSLHSSPGFINIHREIHPKDIKKRKRTAVRYEVMVWWSVRCRINTISSALEEKATRSSTNIFFLSRTYPCTSDTSAWCLDRGGGCALGIRSILFAPITQSKSKYCSNAVTNKYAFIQKVVKQ